MNMLDIVTIIFYISIFSMGNGQVVFELMDSDFNEVVFVDETNITLRCSFNGSETTDVTIRIEDPDGSKLTENNQAMSAEYTIQNLTMDQGGVYKCNVVYMCVDGNNVTVTATLRLNVQDDSEPRCFRNGTVGNPYKPGDRLLLSCYCRRDDKCMWSTRDEVNESGSTVANKNITTISRGEKIIRRLPVQYVSDTDRNIIYGCFKSNSTKICNIGPLARSINDTIVNTIVKPQAVEDCVVFTREVTPSEGSALGMTSESYNVIIPVDDNSSLTTIFFIGGAGAIVLILCVIVVIVLIFISVVGREKTKRTPAEKNKITTKTIPPCDTHTNNKTTNNDLSSSYYEVTDDNCLYDAPPMNNGVGDNQDGENYSEVKGPESSRPQPTNEKYDEINRSDIGQPPSGMTNSKRNSNYDQSELGASNVNEEQVLPTAPDRVLYATIDKSKSTRNTKHREVASNVSDEEPVTYATVYKKRSRVP